MRAGEVEGREQCHRDPERQLQPGAQLLPRQGCTRRPAGDVQHNLPPDAVRLRPPLRCLEVGARPTRRAVSNAGSHSHRARLRRVPGLVRGPASHRSRRSSRKAARPTTASPQTKQSAVRLEIRSGKEKIENGLTMRITGVVTINIDNYSSITESSQYAVVPGHTGFCGYQ